MKSFQSGSLCKIWPNNIFWKGFLIFHQPQHVFACKHSGIQHISRYTVFIYAYILYCSTCLFSFKFFWPCICIHINVYLEFLFYYFSFLFFITTINTTTFIVVIIIMTLLNSRIISPLLLCAHYYYYFNTLHFIFLYIIAIILVYTLIITD